MITTKTCGTCEHFPNDHHCVGCLWDWDKGENTKWELKKNPIVIERKVLDEIRNEIDSHCGDNRDRNDGLYIAMKIIDKYRTGREDRKCHIV